MERWAGHAGPGPGRATRDSGELVGRRMGQHVSMAVCSVLLASHQACQEHECFLPYGRGGVERGGGLVPPAPPMVELSTSMNL